MIRVLPKLLKKRERERERRRKWKWDLGSDKMTAAPERGQADGFLGPLGDGALGHGVSLHGWVLLRPYAKWKLGYPERRRLHAYDAFQC